MRKGVAGAHEWHQHMARSQTSIALKTRSRRALSGRRPRRTQSRTAHTLPLGWAHGGPLPLTDHHPLHKHRFVLIENFFFFCPSLFCPFFSSAPPTPTIIFLSHPFSGR